MKFRVIVSVIVFVIVIVFVFVPVFVTVFVPVLNPHIIQRLLWPVVEDEFVGELCLGK